MVCVHKNTRGDIAIHALNNTDIGLQVPVESADEYHKIDETV